MFFAYGDAEGEVAEFFTVTLTFTVGVIVTRTLPLVVIKPLDPRVYFGGGYTWGDKRGYPGGAHRAPTTAPHMSAHKPLRSVRKALLRARCHFLT